MKQSMFLFLLFFTLTTSVDFEIKRERGLHIWNISNDWNEKPQYERIGYPNNSNEDISKSPSSHLDIPNSGNLKRTALILDTFNTYVILQVNYFHHVFLYYWVGAKSSKEKRINVVHSVGFILKHEILMNMPGENLKLFHREIEGAESSRFTRWFKLPRSKNNVRLYRIAGNKGQFIMEVPLIYNELNGSDSFVLKKHKKVFIWNSFHSNKHRIYQAEVLSKQILEGDKDSKFTSTKFVSVAYDQNEKTRTYNDVTNKFFEVLEGVPESRQFPRKKANYCDEVLENQIREKLKLYEYSWFLNHVMKRKVQWKILTLEIFKQSKTYVLIDFYCGNIFAILGSNARTELIKIALSSAEKFSESIGVRDAWQRVRIIFMSRNLPTYFRIYLHDEQLKL